MREEHGLRVFENGVLRRIFAPKRDEVTGEWRKLHNEELNPEATNFIYMYIEHLFLMFLDHTQRHTTVGRTPLDE